MSGAVQFRDFVDQVRAATDIVDIIGRDVELTQAGSMLKGFSPFRQESHPSFFVWPGTQSWCDFSSAGRSGGDVFAYIQEKQGFDFKEALDYLAKRAGVKPPNQDEKAFKAEISQLEERREIEKLLTKAAVFYHTRLPDKIRQNLFKTHYGFSDKTIDDLLLGWADGHLLDYFIKELHVSQTLALKTGLFIVTKEGPRDFFRNRLVFPYWKRGQVVYFTARATEHTGDDAWEQAKYKKQLTHVGKRPYVSTTVQNDFFYNEDAAADAEDLLITEGVTDCISAIQAGVPCISPTTTQFRRKDIPKLLELTRHAKKVVICNDNEANGAGIAGALETAQKLFEAGRDVRLITLPKPDGEEKIDLNAFLKEKSSAEFLSLFERAERYIVALIHQIPEETSKLDLTERLKPILKRLAPRSPFEQDGYIELICKRFKVGKRDTKQIVEKYTREWAKTQTESKNRVELTKGRVLEAENHYFVPVSDDEIIIISSFHIEPRERVRLENGEMIIGDITTMNGPVFRNVPFPPSAWHAKRNFLSALPSADMQWTGTDDNLQGVLRLLSKRNIPTRQGTQVLGYLDTDRGPRWVTKDLVVAPEGPEADSDIVYVPNGSKFEEFVHYRDGSNDEIRAMAAEVLPLLLQVNEPAVVLPILGWFFATPFKSRLMRIIRHFPVLWVWGTKGSGKSTICHHVFWRLFGVVYADPLSVTQTEFALIKLLSCTSSIPIFLDEYRPDDMLKQRVATLHRYLRRIYGGEVEQRGKADQTLVSYRLSAPVCIGGEARADDPALVDRMISVTPDHNLLQSHDCYREAFKQIERFDIGQFALPYIQFALQQETDADYRRAVVIAEEAIAKIPGADNISHRCRDNLHVVVFGLTMFKLFSESLGVKVPDLDLTAALSASVADLMDGEKGAKSPLDLFIETCSVLAYSGTLIENTHYAVIERDTCLHLRSCWEVFLEHRRKTGQQVDASAFRVLRRLLRENHERGGYVKDLSKVVNMDERRVRTVAISIAQAGEFLEVEEFPRSRERSWGGVRYTAPFPYNEN